MQVTLQRKSHPPLQVCTSPHQHTLAQDCVCARTHTCCVVAPCDRSCVRRWVLCRCIAPRDREALCRGLFGAVLACVGRGVRVNGVTPIGVAWVVGGLVAAARCTLAGMGQRPMCSVIARRRASHAQHTIAHVLVAELLEQPYARGPVGRGMCGRPAGHRPCWRPR